MTTTALNFSAEVNPLPQSQWGWVVSLKLGGITIREWTTTESSVNDREGLEVFLAAEFGTLFREAARAEYERAVADEMRMRDCR